VRVRALTPAEIAWIAVIPCAIVVVAAMAVLGPPLGRMLFPTASEGLWPSEWWAAAGRPEPEKHGRYVLALLLPLLLSGAVLVGSRRQLHLGPRTTRVLAICGQAAVLACAVVGVLGQRNVVLVDRQLPQIFGLGTLVLAAALVAVAAILLRRREAVARIAALACERARVRVASLTLAIVFTLTWLVEALNSDALAEDVGSMNWIPNGTYAVLDGRTPLVDVHIAYSKLLPYPSALVLSVFGASTFVFALFMTLLTALTLLAVYAVLRRITGSAYALALYLPFVALSDVDHWFWLGSIWPMRYGGAYLLAWLTVRHLDGAWPRRPWILFFVAGIVTLDDLDFGFAALVATGVALLCARPPGSIRDAGRLAASVAIGVTGAIALVTAFTFVRSGEVPRLDVLLEWPRTFTHLGWFELPMPRASLHLALFATFVGAVAVAAVRLASRARDVLLTSMLAWIGVFGLVGGNYYVARPDDLKLVAMFSAWGLALALLTVVCVRAWSARAWRAPQPAELLVLFAFALAVCTIARFPSPVKRIDALVQAKPAVYREIAEPFVSRFTRRGEKVTLLIPEGYRVAYDLGLENVSPYEMETVIVSHRQMQTLLDAIEREHVRALFTPTPGEFVTGDAEAPVAHMQLFRRAGFRPVASESSMIAWRRAG